MPQKWPATGGVVDLRDETRRAKLMAITPVDEVWGIGRKLTTKLSAQGINTVADLVAADAKSLRHRYGVVVERTVQELCGIPCAELEQLAQAKQQIICSRSFGSASPPSAPCGRLSLATWSGQLRNSGQRACAAAMSQYSFVRARLRAGNTLCQPDLHAVADTHSRHP